MKQFITLISIVLLGGCATYPERFTYDEGVVAIDSKPVCCDSMGQIQYLDVPEKNPTYWAAGIDAPDTVLLHDGSKTFYRGFDLGEAPPARVVVRSIPTSPTLSGKELYMFPASILLLDSNFVELARLSWDEFKYTKGKGIVRPAGYVASIDIPKEARYMLTLSLKKDLYGQSVVLVNSPSLIGVFTVKQKQIPNAPVGTVGFEFE